MQCFFLYKRLAPSYTTALLLTVLVSFLGYFLSDIQSLRSNPVLMAVTGLLGISVMLQLAAQILQKKIAGLWAIGLAVTGLTLAVFNLLCTLVAPHFYTLDEVYGLARNADRHINTSAEQLLWFYILCGLIVLAGFGYTYWRHRKPAMQQAKQS